MRAQPKCRHTLALYDRRAMHTSSRSRRGLRDRTRSILCSCSYALLSIHTRGLGGWNHKLQGNRLSRSFPGGFVEKWAWPARLDALRSVWRAALSPIAARHSLCARPGFIFGSALPERDAGSANSLPPTQLCAVSASHPKRGRARPAHGRSKSFRGNAGSAKQCVGALGGTRGSGCFFGPRCWAAHCARARGRACSARGRCSQNQSYWRAVRDSISLRRRGLKRSGASIMRKWPV